MGEAVLSIPEEQGQSVTTNLEEQEVPTPGVVEEEAPTKMATEELEDRAS